MQSRRDFLSCFMSLMGSSLVLARSNDSIAHQSIKRNYTGINFSKLRSKLMGNVILPGDPHFYPRKLATDPRFEPKPIAIIQPSSDYDVQHIIEFARLNSIEISIRSGGHSYIGASVCDGIIVDMCLLNSISRTSNHSFSIGPGAQLGSIYSNLYCKYNLTIPSGSCDTVGLGGIALGGGFGFLQREHGLTCDRVQSARIVLADSSIVTASPNENQDLYWAIRGGGSGFGVVTSFNINAVPYRVITVISWSWPLSLANEVILHFYKLCESEILPRHTTASLVFNDKSVVGNHPHFHCTLYSTGSFSQVEQARDFFIGPTGIAAIPGSISIRKYSYPTCHRLTHSSGSCIQAKSSMVFGPPSNDAGSEICKWLLARKAVHDDVGNEYAAVNIFSLGGAVSDISPAATAFHHRLAKFEVQYLVSSLFPTIEFLLSSKLWLQGLYSSVAPRFSSCGSGGYLNYADEDLDSSVYPGHYWGANYDKLQDIKGRVDPANFFSGKQSIRPMLVQI